MVVGDWVDVAQPSCSGVLFGFGLLERLLAFHIFAEWLFLKVHDEVGDASCRVVFAVVRTADKRDLKRQLYSFLWLCGSY